MKKPLKIVLWLFVGGASLLVLLVAAFVALGSRSHNIDKTINRSKLDAMKALDELYQGRRETDVATKLRKCDDAIDQFDTTLKQHPNPDQEVAAKVFHQYRNDILENVSLEKRNQSTRDMHKILAQSTSDAFLLNEMLGLEKAIPVVEAASQ